jgi:hypothetical protein
LSGRDLINDMRAGGGLPVEPRKSQLADYLLIGLVVAAIGAAAYFGLNSGLGAPHSAPPAAPMAALAVANAEMAWTGADRDRCLARARTAADSIENYSGTADSPAPPNSAVTVGYAGLSTLIECHMTLKPARFCDPGQRSALVTEINDYLGRTDFVMAGMVVEGAPMKVMGNFMGGEVDAGSSIYDMEHESTVKLMQGYRAKVSTAMGKLARDGLLAPSDFAGFMGVSDTIKAMFGAVKAERKVCTPA